MESSNRYIDLGLLILRIGIGMMFIYHGFPKIMGGPQVWEGVGKAMSVLGITFVPKFWGLVAACTELFGGIAIMSGLFFKPFCVLLTIEMAIASTMHLSKGDGLLTASHAIEMGIVFLSLIFIGPGEYIIGKF